MTFDSSVTNSSEQGQTSGTGSPTRLQADRDKSPQYPAFPLADALEAATLIKDRIGFAPVAKDDNLAKAIGHNSQKSGSFMQKIATLGYFGLTEQVLTKTGAAGLKLADEAKKYLFCMVPAEKAVLLASFFFTPESFADIAESLFESRIRFDDKDAIVSRLISKKFSEKGARKCANSFVASFSILGLTEDQLMTMHPSASVLPDVGQTSASASVVAPPSAPADVSAVAPSPVAAVAASPESAPVSAVTPPAVAAGPASPAPVSTSAQAALPLFAVPGLDTFTVKLANGRRAWIVTPVDFGSVASDLPDLLKMANVTV